MQNNMNGNNGYRDIDFLRPTINSIRKSIKGIEDSYNNYWDILAELIQNSVDAITKRNNGNGKIEIIVNDIEKSLEVKDNGNGFKSSDIEKLLLPFSTNKENDSETVGEKGVGLKFALFQSNSFIMNTRSMIEEFGSIVEINNASNWKKRTDESKLPLKLKEKVNLEVGTDIKVIGIDNDDIFSMTIKQLEFLLRTKTAIGNVDNLFEDENKKNIEVKLDLVDPTGKKTSKNIPFIYWTPIYSLKNNEILNLDSYKEWVSAVDRDEIQKRNKLKDKIIFKKGKFNHSGNRELKYWMCYVPKRSSWNELSKRDGLVTEEELKDDNCFLEKHMCLHQPLLTASVKGMPTGIIISNPKAGKDGYWQNIFVIIEDKQLKFDIGRKAINGKIVSIYQGYLKKIFNEVTGSVSKYILGDVAPINSQWARDEIIEDIKSKPDLNSTLVKYHKIPYEQEAGVCAIFYELIGSGIITSFTPYFSGYKNKYDLYATFKKHFVVMEFKTHLRNVINDFDNETKIFNELNYIVCWDVNDDDVSAFSNIGVSLQPKDNSDAKDSTYAPETTHILLLANVNPVYVIDLKEVLRRKSIEE